jgi:arabinofuranan 3-O-arabinosyltransferase
MFFAPLSGWLVIENVSANRNGFVTAVLIGGVPVHAGRRPVVAECLGLLSYMPQSGLLFPVVLTLDGRRRTIAATAAAVALGATALLAFGSASWRAFFEWMPVTGTALLAEDRRPRLRLRPRAGVRSSQCRSALPPPWS